jgi:pantoate--beta-alanine ligase
VVSVFVNPLQFAPHEDLDNYPRVRGAITRLIAAAGVDALFAPTRRRCTRRDSRRTSRSEHAGRALCGDAPRHFFRGVTTVVAKLFNAVHPAGRIRLG